MSRFALICIVIISLVSACGKKASDEKAADQNQSTTSNYPMASDFTLQDLDGNSVSLSSLRGKVVIIDFWATWCGPCVMSFPAMQAAVNKFRDDAGVVFLFINTAERGSDIEENVSRFIRTNNYDVRVLLDVGSNVARSYGVQGIPTKVLIDAQGRIRDKKVGGGGNQADVVAEMVGWIEKAKS
jgi:thiol-disulfide isomerase/thioredoxin